MKRTLWIALALAGCNATAPTPSPTPTSSDPVVQVAHPSNREVGARIAYTGSLESPHQTAIAPEVAGLLKDVRVRVGDRVRPGQVLAIVDDSQLEAQASQAQASLLAAQSGVQTALANEGAARDQVLTAEQTIQTANAQLAEALAAEAKSKAQLGLAQRNFARTAAVYQQDLISAQSLDQARVQVESARADLASARSQVAARQGGLSQARAQVKVAHDQSRTALSQIGTARAQAGSLQAAFSAAEVRRNYATLTSPIEGVVLSRNLDPGAAVSPSTPILVIATTRHLRVSIEVDESDVPFIYLNQKMNVVVDSYPDHTFSGTVRNVAGGLDPATRTLRAELQVHDPSHLLRPGMSARVEAVGAQVRGVVLPLGAVFSDRNKTYVWKLEGKRPHRVQVKMLKIQDGEAVLRSRDLSTSDLVVISGVDQMAANVSVRPVLNEHVSAEKN